MKVPDTTYRRPSYSLISVVSVPTSCHVGDQGAKVDNTPRLNRGGFDTFLTKLHRIFQMLTRRSPVPVDPLRHQALVAETFVRDGAALDAGEPLGKGHLLG